MNKLIIHNKTDLSDKDVLVLISHVVKVGRISNNERQYCPATSLSLKGERYVIYSKKNLKSDKFTIMIDNHF